ncbi:O-antigen ligase family protein [Thiolapillus sp.]
MYITILTITISSVFFLSNKKGFHYTAPGAIELVSLCYFSLLCIIGLVKKRYYYLSLPLVIISVPNAINDIFPGHVMGPPWEINSSVFSFITHIEIYLAIGIFRYWNFSENEKDTLPYAFFISSLLAALAIFKFIEYIDTETIGYYTYGLYQIRYILLIIPIAYLFNPNRDFRPFFIGLVAASLLLVVESFITTQLHYGSLSGRLSSGNFATNVYGNMLAALFVFIAYAGNKLFSSAYYNLMIASVAILLFISLILTETRASLISIFPAILLIALYKNSYNKSFTYIALFIAFIISTYFIYLSIQYLIYNEVISDSYVYQESTSSLHSRFILWSITTNIILDNLILGIGNGVWNYIKYDYGSPFEVLLDPHNDYLMIFASYGIIGLISTFYIYIYPTYKSFTSINKYSTLGSLVSVFIVPLSISAISNANSSKHQLFALLLFLVIVWYKYRNTILTRRT